MSSSELNDLWREKSECGRSSAQATNQRGWRCYSSGGRPPVGPLVLFPLALLGPMSSATDVLFEIAESSFTLMLFEPARRGQTFGRWNVDPVYIALLWTGYSCIPVLRSARQALVRKAR
jgi:hypothetical protein